MPSPAPSSYAVIMVPMDPGAGARDRAKVAVELAQRFSSRLIGIAADQIAAPLYVETPVEGIASIIELEERRIVEDIAKAEKSFRDVAGRRKEVEWRSARKSLLAFTIEQARAADLIIARRRTKAVGPMDIDPGDLVMNAGRPMLMIPPGVDRLSAKRIVVGWKDTRESRRAVWDSLPLLKQATEVSVISFDATNEGAKDVSAYLQHHGVEASAYARAAKGGSVAVELVEVANEQGADLMVCGAYGHARTREWVFGGVTRELMERSPICCLMSH